MLTLPPALAAADALRGIDFYWHFPLAIVLISLVYSATRYDQWSLILREAVRWGLRLTCFLFAVVLALLLVATVV